MYIYDDFYDNYSEFDCQIEEFKRSILKGVKDEFIEKLEKLEKENKELQGIKLNFDEVKREYQRKIIELENYKETLDKQKLSTIIDKYLETFYYPRPYYAKNKKCDKCNNNRYIEYITPTGKEAQEPCDVCYCSVKYFKVATTKSEKIYTKFGRDNLTEPIVYFVFDNNYDDRYDVERVEKIIEKEEEFSEYTESYNKRTIFTSYELCQKYCDLQNKGINFNNLEIKEELENEK